MLQIHYLLCIPPSIQLLLDMCCDLSSQNMPIGLRTVWIYSALSKLYASLPHITNIASYCIGSFSPHQRPKFFGMLMDANSYSWGSTEKNSIPLIEWKRYSESKTNVAERNVKTFTKCLQTMGRIQKRGNKVSYALNGR